MRPRLPPRAAVATLAVLLALLLPLLAPPAAAQLPFNETVTPAAPEPFERFAVRVVSFFMYLAGFAGLVAVIIGFVKFFFGAEDAGKWIGKGLVMLVAASGLWAFIEFFLT